LRRDRRTDVHDPQAPFAEAQRDRRVRLEPQRQRVATFGRAAPQPRAGDDVDVLGIEVTVDERLHAPARIAGHLHRLAQIRRQLVRGGEIESAGLRIDDPNPTGRKVERAHDLAQRGLERTFDVGRRQSARDRIEQRDITFGHNPRIRAATRH